MPYHARRVRHAGRPARRRPLHSPPTGEREVVDHYLDTADPRSPEGGLRRADLREREGTDRWLLTAKVSARREGGARARRIRMRRARGVGAPGPLAGVSRPRDRPQAQPRAGPRGSSSSSASFASIARWKTAKRAVGELSPRHRERRHRRAQDAHPRAEIELGPSRTREDLEAPRTESLQPYALALLRSQSSSGPSPSWTEHADIRKRKKKRALGVRDG